MAKQERLREAKQHGAAWFPFNIYPCTIPKDFPQVALHWQDSMELVFVKKGRGIVQAGLTTYTAQAGDIYVFAPGVLHALRQLPGEAMEYENIIFELELLGGAGDICAEKYLLPLQSGRLALPMRLGPEDWGYNWAVRCLHAAEEFNKIKDVGYELCIKGELLLFLAQNPNIVFSRDTLFDRIWGMDAIGDTATVTVHVNRIREKIEEDPSNPVYIETIWGVGYRFKV
mgnify:CR=1 FL=1